MTMIYNTTACASSRVLKPRFPYPLRWRPRIYGASFGLGGPGGADA